MEDTKKVSSRKKKAEVTRAETPTLAELLRADQELRTMWRLIRDYDLREKAVQRLDRALSKLGKSPLTVH